MSTFEDRVVASAACESSWSSSRSLPRPRAQVWRRQQNLKPYDADEPRRFVSYFEAMASQSSIVVATAGRQVQ